METVCPECGSEYERIGTHWRYNSDHRPQLSEEQKHIITGILMGDGHLNRSGKNKRLRVGSTTEDYLVYLDRKVFPVIGQGVSLSKTAEELAKRNRNKSGSFETVNEDNYSDVYWWETCSHPDLSEFSCWYSSGSKVFPEDVRFSPSVLTHWYVGDGTFDNRWNPRILIAASNESGQKDKLRSYFSTVNLPEPHFSESERKSGGVRMNLMWDSDESRELLEYMDGPIPGFEYKWPDRYK